MENNITGIYTFEELPKRQQEFFRLSWQQANEENEDFYDKYTYLSWNFMDKQYGKHGFRIDNPQAAFLEYKFDMLKYIFFEEY